jgi:type IV pilus assembly protein PilM
MAESIWKKEITFRRKSPAKVSARPVPSEPQTAAAAPVRPLLDATPATQVDTQVAFWKREVTLGRRQRNEKKEPVAEQPVARLDERVRDTIAQASATAKQVPLWKREVAIGRRQTATPKPEPVVDATAPPTSPQPVTPVTPVAPLVPVAPVPEALEPGAAEPDLEETFETWPQAPAIETETALPAAESVTEPDVLPPPTPVAKRPRFWKREVTPGRREAHAPKREAPKGAKVKGKRGARGSKRFVGLKIGASQLSAARVSNNGVAELLQVAREPLSPGVVAGGEVRDADALALALKDFFAKHKLPKRGVRLGIANNRIGVRTFEVAGIEDAKQLENAVRFRAQESLPIPIDEAVLDFQVIGERTDEEGRLVRRILLVVAYREQIDRWVDACKKAGIPLVGIDLEAFALLRALQAPQDGAGKDPTSALVAVAIGHERSTLAVSDGRTCEFTRVLEWGGAALNIALARALHSAPSEVEGIKRSLSLADGVTPEGLTPDQAAAARDALRGAIQSFARELVSSLHFYQNQPGSLGLGEIVLTGGTAHLPGLAPELEQLTGVHVRVGDPLARMHVSKRVREPEQLGSFSVAIGLGIED